MSSSPSLESSDRPMPVCGVDHRPVPVVPAASDPHGPVIVKYTVLASYLVTFITGLAPPRPNRNRERLGNYVRHHRSCGKHAGPVRRLTLLGDTATLRQQLLHLGNYYIWNLALADELFVLTLPFFCYATWTGDWIFGPVTCKVIPLS